MGNPSWFVPLMLTLMLIGLVWVVTFYITQEKYPVESWGRWNLGGGFAFILAGFAMTTRWK
ncbi:septation inhibitor protein [Janibacter sp. Soil728]|nr:septation inhibitor protein [Janibacter sp. Soil728]